VFVSEVQDNLTSTSRTSVHGSALAAVCLAVNSTVAVRAFGGTSMPVVSVAHIAGGSVDMREEGQWT